MKKNQRIFLFLALTVLLWCTNKTVEAAPSPKSVGVKNEISRYPFIEVKMKLRLQHRNSIRLRTKSFTAYRLRSKTRSLRMQNGPVWMNLKITIQPPGQIVILGALQLGKSFRPIRLTSGSFSSKREWSFVHKAKLKRAQAEIQIKALLLARPRGHKKSTFNVDFKKIPLKRVLRKLAEFNNLRLSLDSSVQEIPSVNIKLKATSRKALIQLVCQRFNLTCNIMGKVLWVRSGALVPRR